jgi:hypothetical protein
MSISFLQNKPVVRSRVVGCAHQPRKLPHQAKQHGKDGEKWGERETEGGAIQSTRQRDNALGALTCRHAHIHGGFELVVKRRCGERLFAGKPAVKMCCHAIIHNRTSLADVPQSRTCIHARTLARARTQRSTQHFHMYTCVCVCVCVCVLLQRGAPKTSRTLLVVQASKSPLPSSRIAKAHSDLESRLPANG